MKKITLFIFLLTVSFGFSQTELLNLSFDASGSESIWTPIADAASNPAEVNIAYNASGNPTGATELSGVNTSDVAGRAYIFRYDNAAFNFGTSGGVSISMDVKIDVALSGTNLVFETQVSKVGGGVVVVTNNNLENSVTAGAGWVNLTFDMTPNTAEFNNAGTELYFYFNMAAGAFVGAGGTILVDNIVVTGSAPVAPTCSDGIENGDETGIDCGGSCPNACITDPVANAPIPSTPEGEVLSIYSDTYTTNVATNFNFQDFTGGGPNTEEEIEGVGNGKTGKLQNLTFYGPAFDAINLSSYSWVHLDYYATTSSSIKFFVIDGDLGACCGDAREPRYTIEPSGGDEVLVQGSWQSVDIPLTFFINNPSLAGLTWDGNPVTQLKFEGDGDLYFDNIYFSVNQGTVLGTDDYDLESFSVYPNPTQDSWNLKSKNENISSIRVFDILGKSVMSLAPNSNEATIDGASLKSGLYFAQVKTANGVSSLKLVKQ